MKMIWLAAPFFMLSGCLMSAGKKPFPLKETEPVMVRDCRRVGKYPGPVGYRFWGPPATLGDFKYQIALKAKAQGATHIYWRDDPEGIEGAIYGFAFDCSGVASMMKDGDDFE